MTWREQRTNNILITIVLILVSLNLIVAGIHYRAGRDASNGTDAASAAPGGADAADTGYYSALTYSNNAATLSFSQNEEGVWQWDAGTDFPLDDTTVQEILNSLVNWHPQQVLTDQESLDASGLSEPTGSLSATAAKGGATTLLFGKATVDGTSCYVRLNGDESTVYIIDNAIQRLMDVPIYDMCRLPELPALTEGQISSVTLQGPAPEAGDDASQEEGGGETRETGPEITLTAQHGDGTTLWRSNGSDVTGNATVQGLLQNLLGMRLSRCIDFDPSDEAAEICGFANPQATVRIRYFPEAGQEEQELVLVIGDRLPDKSGRYARLGEESPIYLVETAVLDPLMRVAAAGLVDEGA